MKSNVPFPCKKVKSAALQSGLSIEIQHMDDSTRTAREAADAIGCEVSQIVKSLIFRGERSLNPILLLVSGANHVDETKIAGIFGEPIIRPDAKFVREVTGFAIGGIPPFGHANKMQTYLDRDLLKYETVFAAAGTPNTIFGMDPNQLAGATQGEIINMA